VVIIIGVDGIEEVFDAADGGQLLKDEGTLEVLLIHHAPPWSQTPTPILSPAPSQPPTPALPPMQAPPLTLSGHPSK
jgi:hypothetical protein